MKPAPSLMAAVTAAAAALAAGALLAVDDSMLFEPQQVAKWVDDVSELLDEPATRLSGAQERR